MRINEFITESFQTVSINGILYSLNTDEKAIYTKVKEAGKLLKKDLSEFDARVANGMVTKGLLKRRKNPQQEIYFVTKGRRKNAPEKPIEEVAPPDSQIEKWINDNKERFEEKYGKEYKKYLYGKAWNKFNGKKMVKESVEDNTPKFVKDNTEVFANIGDIWTNIYNHKDYEVTDIEFLDFTYEDKVFKSPLYILKNTSNNVEPTSTCNNYNLVRDFKKVQYDWDGEDDEDELMETVHQAKFKEGQKLLHKTSREEWTVRNINQGDKGIFYDIVRPMELSNGETATIRFTVGEQSLEKDYENMDYPDDTKDDDYWDGE